MGKSKEVMLCMEKEREGELQVLPIAKIVRADPMGQLVLAMPYQNRTVTTVSLPRAIIDRALADGCKRWVVRLDPPGICYSMALNRVKRIGRYQLTGGHYEYFVPLELFDETEYQKWDFIRVQEQLFWTPQDSIPHHDEPEMADLFDEEMSMKAKATEGKKPAPAPAAPVAQAPDIPVTTAPVAASAKLIEEPPAPKPAPAKETVAPPPAPASIPVIVKNPVTDASDALIASLEQSIALITQGKVTLTIMRSADHPVMGEMWIGVFKVITSSGYGEHIFPIVGGGPIEVAVTAAYTLGDRKAAYR